MTMHVILFFLALVAVFWIAFRLLENRLQGYRTVVLNVVQSLPVFGGALVELMEQYRVSDLVPQKYMWGYLAGVIALNILYRMGTSTGIGRKPGPEPMQDLK
jgi:hypothetical protein